jgi:hypothetical protein
MPGLSSPTPFTDHDHFIVLYNFSILNQLSGTESLRSHQLLSHSWNSEYFMECKGSLLCSQEPATGLWPEPEMNPVYIFSSYFFKIHLKFYFVTHLWFQTYFFSTAYDVYAHGN